MSQPNIIVYSSLDVDKIPMLPDNQIFTGTNTFTEGIIVGVEGEDTYIQGVDATTADTVGCNLILTGGKGKGVADGGGFTLSSGDADQNGQGGGLVLSAGSGGVSDGDGGDLTLNAGNAQGGDTNGGSVIFNAGSNHGSGDNGTIQFTIADGIGAHLNLDSLTSTDKTFTFPDVSGTFALLEASNSFIGTNKFGSATDYVQIDASGEFTLNGAATTWDDMRVAGHTTRTGASAPSLGAFGPSGSLQTLLFESGKDEMVYFEIQMSHRWKEGTKIYPHVHWTPVNATAGNVVWELEYAWTSITGTFGAPSTMATDATAAGGTAWVHKMTDLKSGGNNYIDGTGQTISSMLVCRLHRNAGAGSDTLAANVAFLEFDLHFEIDGMGSKTSSTK